MIDWLRRKIQRLKRYELRRPWKKKYVQWTDLDAKVVSWGGHLWGVVNKFVHINLEGEVTQVEMTIMPRGTIPKAGGR